MLRDNVSDGSPVLFLVIPCYNEESVLPVTSSLFRKKMLDLMRENKISEKSRILFVNDGSTDATWSLIQNLAKEDTVYMGISQSRNRGQQNALYAGLMESKDLCDIAVTMDCDGQDDIDAIGEMIAKYQEGYDVVYGVRNDRSTDGFFKKHTAESYYNLMKKMGADIVFNHSDYRLLSKRVLEVLEGYRESHLFLRGLIPQIGFSQAIVFYKRNERLAGKTHYSLKTMVKLGCDGIIGFSLRPIRLITIFGLMVVFLGLVMAVWLIGSLCFGWIRTGWLYVLCAVMVLGGCNLTALGIIGEYIGKTSLEVKHRPRYIISDRTESTTQHPSVGY